MKARIFVRGRGRGRGHIISHLPRNHIPHEIPKPCRHILRSRLRHNTDSTTDSRRCKGQRGQGVILLKPHALHGFRGTTRLGTVHLMFPDPPLQRGVPVVLHRIVSPTWEQAGYGGPPVPVPCMCGQDGLVLGRREGPPLHGRTQLVTPPEPARLARPALNVTANQGPVPRAISLDKTLQNLVFFSAPWTFDSLCSNTILT